DDDPLHDVSPAHHEHGTTRDGLVLRYVEHGVRGHVDRAPCDLQGFVWREDGGRILGERRDVPTEDVRVRSVEIDRDIRPTRRQPEVVRRARRRGRVSTRLDHDEITQVRHGSGVPRLDETLLEPTPDEIRGIVHRRPSIAPRERCARTIAPVLSMATSIQAMPAANRTTQTRQSRTQRTPEASSKSSIQRRWAVRTW